MTSSSDTTVRPFDAVMFDMDGTLVNSQEAILASYHDATTSILGEPFPVEKEDVEKIIQMRGQESFPLIAGGDHAKAEEIRKAFGEAYKIHQERIPLFPDVEVMLRTLKDAGIKLGIATSKARERLEADLERTGIAEYFDLTLTGDDVANAKPAPDQILAGIEQFGIEPERMLFVGDGSNDVVAGRDAGAKTAGVEFGFHPELVAAENPTYMLASYMELIPIVLPEEA
jgi:haloacid dehalogenase superfamily, subfamily IA, variant 3 with third motif having DD or ED/haloacid dehalogenase superfamily, subfamily IA, variant 1 with third motif having Dx(3-4)D or Dx(3-4)E